MNADAPQKRTWLVLGASSSIGRAFARLAAKQGADILLAGRDTDDLNRTAADVALRAGVEVDVVQFDAADFDSHAAFAADCARRDSAIDVFLLFGTMHDQDDSDENFDLLRRTVDVNYLGAVSILDRLAPVLGRAGRWPCRGVIFRCGRPRASQELSLRLRERCAEPLLARIAGPFVRGGRLGHDSQGGFSRYRHDLWTTGAVPCCVPGGLRGSVSEAQCERPRIGLFPENSGS